MGAAKVVFFKDKGSKSSNESKRFPLLDHKVFVLSLSDLDEIFLSSESSSNICIRESLKNVSMTMPYDLLGFYPVTLSLVQEMSIILGL